MVILSQLAHQKEACVSESKGHSELKPAPPN